MLFYENCKSLQSVLLYIKRNLFCISCGVIVYLWFMSAVVLILSSGEASGINWDPVCECCCKQLLNLFLYEMFGHPAGNFQPVDWFIKLTFISVWCSHNLRNITVNNRFLADGESHFLEVAARWLRWLAKKKKIQQLLLLISPCTRLTQAVLVDGWHEGVYMNPTDPPCMWLQSASYSLFVWHLLCGVQTHDSSRPRVSNFCFVNVCCQACGPACARVAASASTSRLTWAPG